MLKPRGSASDLRVGTPEHEFEDSVVFDDGILTFREFAMSEPVPLATIHGAVLEFLRGRDDAVLFGAQAVNAYVDEPRMTQDVDIASTRAKELADEIKDLLNARLHIAVRVREVRGGIGYRIYQVRKPSNRHLVDVRPVKALPPANRLSEILVVTPPELIAGKVNAYQSRRGKPKSGTDWRDLAMLLLAFPELKAHDSEVRTRLEANKADAKVLAVWKELVDQEIVAEEEDEEF
jgi:Nucleotidyl transferase AbiEii toxin, Type IV TA system